MRNVFKLLAISGINIGTNEYKQELFEILKVAKVCYSRKPLRQFEIKVHNHLFSYHSSDLKI